MHFVASLATPAAWAQWTWAFVLELCKCLHLCIVNKTPVVGSSYGMLSAQVHQMMCYIHY